MTTRNVTPAKKTKRVRKSQDIQDDDVQVIRVDQAPTAPTIAARDFAKAAVASHPEAIQRIATQLSKTFIALRVQHDQKLTMSEKLNNNAEFIPRSAKVSFKLTGPASVMEEQEFKTLAASMDEKTQAYQKECKNAIHSVAKLVLAQHKIEIQQHFKKALLQLSSLCLLQQAPLSDPPVKKFAWDVVSDLDPNIFSMTFVTCQRLKNELKKEIDDDDATTMADDVNVQITDDEKTLFQKTKPTLKPILSHIFAGAWSRYLEVFTANETTKALDKQAKEFLVTEATAAAATNLDTEPSLAPSRIRELISEGIKSKTSKLQAELQKLKQSANRNPSAKNSNRGAEPSSKQRAPSTKKKGKNEKEKGKATDSNKEPPPVNDASAVRKGKGSEHKKEGPKKKNGAPSKHPKKKTSSKNTSQA
jgi:hypothetical protein